MKNKNTILFASLICVSITQTINGGAITQSPEHVTDNNTDSTWSKLVAFFYGKDTTKEPIKQIPQVAIPIKSKIYLSREQAIEEIRNVVSDLFNPHDVNHISLHLSKMKQFAKFLDEIQDKKLIAAIHFLLMNHHRSSIIDTVFWLKAIKELKLDTVMPMTDAVAALPKAEKLKLLNKKMTVGN
jgi:hypothetical protein